MSDSERQNAELESRHHTYTGHTIPLLLRLLWIIFWCFAAGYVVKFLLPALQTELLTPP